MNQIPVNIEEDAAQAAEAEKKAQSEPKIAEYTHKFQKPFSWNGQTFETLDFHFDRLTGADSMAVEAEMNAQGRTLVVDSFCLPYLCGMAARACTQRDERGFASIDSAAIAAMPLRDFRKITGRARNFLLQSEL